jgi:hypothetical protein
VALLMKHLLNQPDFNKSAHMHGRDTCRHLLHHRQTVRLCPLRVLTIVYRLSTGITNFKAV